MNRPPLNCKDERRRRETRAKPLNGIDYLEVSPDQRTLTVSLFGPAPKELTPANVWIEGGVRYKVEAVKIESEPSVAGGSVLKITVNQPGDFSLYTLHLVEARDAKPPKRPFAGFDPRYARLDFTFKVDCPSDLDCKTETVCPLEPLPEPDINYLAKDYASFRQLILDRLALTLPEWRERHIPDIGITLVELLAYVGDYLSYYQDAVATEAYLDTARKRISVRRHARLVDYLLHEGCNARAFVFVETENNLELSLQDFYFVTGGAQTFGSSSASLAEDVVRKIAPSQYEAFEPLWPTTKTVSLRKAHSTISFYTWRNVECCLPKGATSATLVYGPPVSEPPTGKEGKGEKPPATPSAEQNPAQYSPAPKTEETTKHQLKKGDLLIFEEVKGPHTGDPADANPAHRHVVRLIKTEPRIDPLNGQQVLEITWAEEDALPFPLCLSAIGDAPDCKLLEDISVAHGNVFVVDHGRRVEGEAMGTVEASATLPKDCDAEGLPTEVPPTPRPFRPHLNEGPLTFHVPLVGTPPASQLLTQDPHQALPWIGLTTLPPEDPTPAEEDAIRPPTDWTPVQDLLQSGRRDRHFVVEMEEDGLAHLRFGDGELGALPEPRLEFQATYRVGIGPQGNVGAEAIRHIVFRRGLPHGANFVVRNPLPAQGGVGPEPIAEAKQFAPSAFRKRLERAITAEDYARLAERDRHVQRAAAVLRWTGSWYEAQVGIDSLGVTEAETDLLHAILRSLQRYRRMGHDLTVRQAHSIPLEIVLEVCVLPHYLRAHVLTALRDLFSNRVLPDGRRGLFHPDNLTFGESVRLSRLVAEAQAVPGVESVRVTTFKRQQEAANNELENGLLPLGPLEIARLDQDPNYPDNGKITFDMRGGRG